jgi:hypothetical protein
LPRAAHPLNSPHGTDDAVPRVLPSAPPYGDPARNLVSRPSSGEGEALPDESAGRGIRLRPGRALWMRPLFSHRVNPETLQTPKRPRTMSNKRLIRGRFGRPSCQHWGIQQDPPTIVQRKTHVPGVHSQWRPGPPMGSAGPTNDKLPLERTAGRRLLGAVDQGFPRFVRVRRCIEAAKFCQNEVGPSFHGRAENWAGRAALPAGCRRRKGQRGLEPDQCDGRGDARVKNFLLAVVPEPAGTERDHSAVVPPHCQLDHYAGTMGCPDVHPGVSSS